MYLPRHFTIEDLAAMHHVIRENSFATLVTAGNAGPFATHLPVLLDAERGPFGTLRAHVARANSQWQTFDGRAQALFIFQGAHGYISPSWYEPGPAVPTWDYVAVHASGRPRLIEDDDQVLAVLCDLVAIYEAGSAAPWRIEDQDPDYVRQLARGIVAFEMTIERLEGKAKLGQNRPRDQESVATQLDAAGNDSLARAIREANGLPAPGI